MPGCSDVLVTFSVSDFPDDSTAPYDLEVISADDFLLDQLDLYPGITLAVLRSQSGDYAVPPMTMEQLLGALAIACVAALGNRRRRALVPKNPAFPIEDLYHDSGAVPCDGEAVLAGGDLLRRAATGPTRHDYADTGSTVSR